MGHSERLLLEVRREIGRGTEEPDPRMDGMGAVAWGLGALFAAAVIIGGCLASGCRQYRIYVPMSAIP